MEYQPVKILLVDGDGAFRSAYAKYFARYPNFEIQEASNGGEGSLLAREIKPDLILSDYQMPVIDGIEFCRRIREAPETSTTIFIILTVEKDEKIKVKAFEQGVDDYIEKSTSPVILTSKIRAFLRIKHLQNELFAEKEKLAATNQTLERNFKELTEILLKIIDLRVPGAADRARSAKAVARFICKKMNIEDDMADKIIFGAQLYEIGKIGLPDTIADKNKGNMVMSDRNIYNQHPIIGSLVISTISGFDVAADSIYHQYENYDGTGIPDGLMGNEIPRGARILRGIVLQGDLCRAGHPREEIIREIRQSANKILEPVVSSSIAEYIIESDKDFAREKCKISLEELTAGMVIGEDIYAASGIKLIPRGVRIQEHMIKVLMSRSESDPIIGGVYVLIGAK